MFYTYYVCDPLHVRSAFRFNFYFYFFFLDVDVQLAHHHLLERLCSIVLSLLFCQRSVDYIYVHLFLDINMIFKRVLEQKYLQCSRVQQMKHDKIKC